MCHCSIERRCNTTLLIVFSIVCVTRISANLVTYQPGLVTMGVSLSQTVVTRHRDPHHAGHGGLTVRPRHHLLLGAAHGQDAGLGRVDDGGELVG